jgi:signal transduction histidine kinase
MNPIIEFQPGYLVVINFLHGLVFFSLGISLALVSRQASEFRFAAAIRPLALFGLLYGAYEWVVLFQLVFEPVSRLSWLPLLLLVSALLMLLTFALTLLLDRHAGRWYKLGPLLLMLLVWVITVWVMQLIINPLPGQFWGVADTLARYLLGLPAALAGTWALMVQQRAFRELNMPQFGRDLVWCAVALLMYGLVSFIFVSATPVAPSSLLNSALFNVWFGLPVPVFQLLLGTVFTVFMLRALHAFEVEHQRRLERAKQAQLDAQTAALEAVRRSSREMESLNEELRVTARELALLLDLSTLLATPMDLANRLRSVLEEIITSLNFSVAGMIGLVDEKKQQLQLAISIGFAQRVQARDEETGCAMALELGEQCIDQGVALCQHVDGQIFELILEMIEDQLCRVHTSPAEMIALPLSAQERIIGSLVLAGPTVGGELSVDEFSLMIGIAQQLGLSLENARLYEDLRAREKMLAELLHQVVGAQEAERRRIARELHDATGQSLTAISLGLRGIEAALESQKSIKVEQIRELQVFGTSALAELRRIIADLRPSQLDDLGLGAALRWYLQTFEKRRHIHCSLTLPESFGRLPADTETVLFRIVQEALTNVAKHAQATKVKVVVIQQPHQIEVTIEDDGRGFDLDSAFSEAEQRGWGLLGIQERVALLGGSHTIDTAPGQGTRIRVIIPFITEPENVEKDPVTAG